MSSNRSRRPSFRQQKSSGEHIYTPPTEPDESNAKILANQRWGVVNNQIDDHHKKINNAYTKNWKKNFNNLDLDSYDPLITNFKIYSHELFVPESIFNDRKKKQGEVERFHRR